jgi:hypothetical protein
LPGLTEKQSISGFLSWTWRNWVLSMGAIWNFSKETVLSWVDIRLWGTKGPSVRPRCIRTMGLNPINQSIRFQT